MSTVTDATNSTTTSATSSTGTSATSSSNTTVNENDFLQLLIAQMQNQDPLNPMDGTQYVAELAQFSSLQELQDLNTNMTTSINANYTLTQSINNTLAGNLIGQQVKVSASGITYSGQTSTEIGYTLPSTASDVTLTITNSAGAEVKTVTGLPTSSGDNEYSWNFTDDNGSTLPQGAYTYSVSATNSSGTSLTPTLFQLGTIQAVNYTSSGTTFTINGSSYNLSDVLELLGTASSSGTSSSGGN
ncbi:MAG: flagellar hook capping FlgD N-terminal domain-containing protein [Ignavibacteriaceae bacterium]|jgi:flagellar basal-body rod modification protein FlgD